MGNEAKLSLEQSNDDALKLWDNLFNSLKSGEKDFQNLRQKNEKYYSTAEKTKKEKKQNILKVKKSKKYKDV